MKSLGETEINRISSDLTSVINDLYKVANGIRSNFYGIGNDICAWKVEDIARQCEYSRERINSINTSKFTDSFLNAHPELIDN